MIKQKEGEVGMEITPYILLKSSNPEDTTFVKKAVDSETVGYDIVVSSYNTPSTSKLRTFNMAEMEVEYNIRQQKLSSITFKDTSVHKEIKLSQDGKGILIVVDGMDTVGENNQARKISKEVIESIKLNETFLYTSPFDINTIYEELTGDLLPTDEDGNITAETSQEFWWSNLSMEEVIKATGIDMDQKTFEKVMLKMQNFLEQEEKAMVPELEQKHENVVKALDVELQETIEVVYMPDKKDLHGEWMNKEEISKAEENFTANLKAGLVKGNLFHSFNTDKFTIEESWVTKLDGTYGEDETFLPEGTWLAKCKFHDNTLWEMKKAGELGGLSFGGKAFVNPTTGEITELTFDPSQDTQANFELSEEGQV
jgi:hypothetical protein